MTPPLRRTCARLALILPWLLAGTAAAQAANEAPGSATEQRARWARALWCKDHGKIAEMREQAEQMLARDPGHRGARRLLGHVEVEGRWLTTAAQKRAAGLVEYRGEWMRKYDAVRAAHADAGRRAAAERAAAERRLARVRGEIDRATRRLASASEKKRRAARAALCALAERENLPQVAQLAGDLFAMYDGFWRERRTALVGVRAQQSRLLGFETRTVSLGVGTPVRIQLPRLRSVSFGGTVAVPLGRGR